MTKNKKGKKAEKRKYHVPNREAFHRMNFLYQAAHSTLVQNPNNIELSRFYIATMKTIAKRLVLRIDPSVKRTICKRCHTLLLPGITSTVRMRAKRERHLVVTCIFCKQVKRFLTREGHQLWSEKPELRLDTQIDKQAADKGLLP
ncbi:ribonuclease P protein subunit p21-like [Saccoglossus kowalevskii]|uniref:Ribonuclease P protein subunit p21-like isoform X1 n=1 Tax=Saccoglossus kowalevskii TaxID=10224 RepID=A0ABM0M8J7_SACKO|nr:PREDICTED: ribonuclease P protein subunit p21-like isoform X1 [Saccoglossus kowalevskii]XP_006816338.1 PREDICTED: ribonuclease P protein subunit p21-like isoform X2 [Saccoglossus kowalevskii]